MRTSDARRAKRPRTRAGRKAGVSLSLLGPPGVEKDGRAVEFETRKAVAILAYLALNPGRQPRERLAAMFWPEASPERARGALRRTLSAIRTSPVGDRLQADNATAALLAEGVAIDAIRFRELRGARKHAQAIALFVGDFLAGFSLRDAPDFEEWQGQQAESLRGELAASLETLIREERDAGRIPRALGHARRWLALDPLNEAAHREVMRLHALAGDRAAALRQYHECVHLLDRELGVAPLEETVALHDAVRAGRAPRDEPATPQIPSATSGVEEAVGDLYTLHGSYAKAVASYEAALAAAPPAAASAIERKLAEVHQRRGDWERAEQHYRHAAQNGDDVAQARALADQSLVAHRRGEPERAVRLARKALLLARDARDDRALAQAHNIVGIISGDRKQLEQALALAERIGDANVRAAALNNLALAHLREGAAEQALPLAERALAEVAELGDRHRQAALHNNLADVLRALGRRDESMRHLKRAAALFSEIGGAREPEVWKLVEW